VDDAGRFYRRRERWTEMESACAALQSAVEHDKRGSGALQRSESLREANRDPPRAAKMLEDYLASPAKTEDAPAFVAHTWLARREEQLGDQAAAAGNRRLRLRWPMNTSLRRTWN
jgi:hypothetical protein